MRKQTKAKLLRWKSIILYALCGAAIYAYPARLWQRLLYERFCEWFEYPRLASGCQTLAGILLLLMFIAFSGTRWRHFRHVFSYPPFLVSVVCAPFLAALLPGIPGGTLEIESVPWAEALTAMTLFTILWVGYTGGSAFVDKLQKPQRPALTDSPAAQAENGKFSDAIITKWLRREEPLNDCIDDLFGLKFIAERLLRRLEKGENTIALQGGFGAGKSSIVSMTKALALEQGKPLIFVHVSCWGFDSAAKAQEEILSQLLRDLGEELDCFAIRKVPSRYMEAMAEQGSWLKSMAKMISGDRSPLEQLKLISPLLTAAGCRAVIFIDDVDRNGQTFDISLIQALLVQLRSIEGLSFVLSISPTQHVDFAKLCEFVELIPKLTERQVLLLIYQVREYLLRQNPPVVIVDRLEYLMVPANDPPMLYTSVGFHISWELAIYSLLSTPRLLKHMLRRVCNAWPMLSGEVNIDDLISMSTLRTAAPGAFSFYLERNSMFEAAANDNRTDLKDDFKTKILDRLSNEWKEICQKGSFDSLVVAWLIKNLDPRSCKVLGVYGASTQKKQSVGNKKRGIIYLRRLVIEELDKEDTLDTPILKSLRDASSNTEEIKHLAERITDSEAASDAFEDLVSSLNFQPHLLSLTSEIYACIRRRHGANTYAIPHPGFFASWNVVKSIDPIPGFEEWLIKELNLCIPDHMHLLRDVYCYWLGPKNTSRVDRAKPHLAILKGLQNAWTQMPANRIGRGFDPSYPYTLLDLIFASDSSNPSSIPLKAAEDWKWIGPILYEAITQEDQVLMAELVLALDSNVKRGNENHSYDLDEHTLSTWFPGQEREVVSLIARGFPIHDQVDVQSKYWIKSAFPKAESWLLRWSESKESDDLKSSMS